MHDLLLDISGFELAVSKCCTIGSNLDLKMSNQYNTIYSSVTHKAKYLNSSNEPCEKYKEIRHRSEIKSTSLKTLTFVYFC